MTSISEKIQQLVLAAKTGTTKDKQAAVKAINPSDLDAFLYATSALQGDEKILADSLMPGSSGVASGIAAFTTDSARRLLAEGKKVILVRPETSAEDTKIMKQCSGVLTLHGGRTSHAVIICRGAGIPCAVGNDKLFWVDNNGNYSVRTNGNSIIKEGDDITIDGMSGILYSGTVPAQTLLPPPELKTLLQWADEVSKHKTYVILDSVADVEKAIANGAKGVSILRTEHMFFEGERTPIFQQVIIETERNQAHRGVLLQQLQQFQEDDFVKLFEAAEKASGKFPINIRLLDPPLHEFFPKQENWEQFISDTGGRYTITDLKECEDRLAEANPMMGKRGVRLLLKQPDLLRMQARAIFSAACNHYKKYHRSPDLSICLPMVEDVTEVKQCKKIIAEEHNKIANEHNITSSEIPYKISAMIEIPSAAIYADELAKEVSNFSFGTHDLTSFMHGIDRDAAENVDIFTTLSVPVIDVIKRASQAKRNTVSLTMGICGDQGKSPESIKALLQEEIPIDYVTATPQDVIKTRLIAAQASLSMKQVIGSGKGKDAHGRTS